MIRIGIRLFYIISAYKLNPKINVLDYKIWFKFYIKYNFRVKNLNITH